MKTITWKSLVALICLGVVSICGTALALDEAVLTPTAERGAGKSITDADKEFDAAMSVWHKHRYAEGEKLLGAFAKKHPDNKWRAEAELHQGCYLTYLGKTSEAKPIFDRLASEFKGTNISTKAQLRLANIAEREANSDEAIRQYTTVLKMNPTWDQFKYANYRARKLAMTGGRLQARINCGPVALSACLDALGRKPEAAAARSITPTPDGLSLGVLESLCATYGVPAKSVEMTLGQLQKAALPILAYVEPKHFIAVLAIKDGEVHVADSIRGGYAVSLDQLGRMWGGRVLTFAPSDDMKPLAQAASLGTIGGCCGQMDEDECAGDPCDCQQTGSGGGGGGGGCGGGPLKAGDWRKPGCMEELSAGRPTWQVNVDNLNILVKDTPVFYSPGKGPKVAFTLNYSNENSNTGIFGRGWRSIYDMKVFFLPSGYPTYPTLQVHLYSGRVETYEWDGQSYAPRSSTANYGYRDTIVKQADGTVVLSLRGGGKYYFMPEGGVAEGRIHYLEDDTGNRITCGYDSSGSLETVTDAAGGITDIITEGTGIDERVTFIRIPRLVNGQWERWSDTDPEARQAELRYTDGNLTYIKDMLGDASTLSYNAMLFYTGQLYASNYTAGAITATSPANGKSLPVQYSTDNFFSSGTIKINNDEEISYTGKSNRLFTGITRGPNPVAASDWSSITQVAPSTTLTGAMTDTSPANGGSLSVDSTASFPNSGWIAVDGIYGAETIYYTGKTSNSFTGITRGNPAYQADANTNVYLCSQSPYLSEIVTPARKTKFAYKWAGNGTTGNFASLHRVYECGPTESYPQLPTLTYDWVSYQTTETRYGNLSKVYDFSAFYDATAYIVDELGNYSVRYGYNWYRDLTSITDANGNTTEYDYRVDKSYDDGLHNVYYARDPMGNEWAFTYYPDHSLHTEADALGRVVKTYTYNSAGQITQVDTPLGTKVINHYDAQGRMDYSTDGRGKTTNYHYNESGETRGLLTSVHDPEGKVMSYHYDTHGRRDQVTDQNGNVTRFEYDDLDRIVKKIYGAGPNDPYVESKYSCCHKVYEQDENGKRTYYVYDAKVRPYKTISSSKSTTLATSITTSIPATGGSLAVASVADMPTSGKVVVGDEIIGYTGRDTVNNLLTGIVRGANGTRIVAADSGSQVGRVDTVPATYGYHPQYLSWVISETDALNHTTYYTYYANGRRETVRYPDNKGERFTFDGNGSGPNLIKKEFGTFTGTYPNQTFTPNNDLTLNYDYNKNNRLIRTYH